MASARRRRTFELVALYAMLAAGWAALSHRVAGGSAPPRPDGSHLALWWDSTGAVLIAWLLHLGIVLALRRWDSRPRRGAIPGGLAPGSPRRPDADPRLVRLPRRHGPDGRGPRLHLRPPDLGGDPQGSRPLVPRDRNLGAVFPQRLRPAVQPAGGVGVGPPPRPQTPVRVGLLPDRLLVDPRVARPTASRPPLDVRPARLVLESLPLGRGRDPRPFRHPGRAGVRGRGPCPDPGARRLLGDQPGPRGVVEIHPDRAPAVPHARPRTPPAPAPRRRTGHDLSRDGGELPGLGAFDVPPADPRRDPILDHALHLSLHPRPVFAVPRVARIRPGPRPLRRPDPLPRPLPGLELVPAPPAGPRDRGHAGDPDDAPALSERVPPVPDGPLRGRLLLGRPDLGQAQAPQGPRGRDGALLRLARALRRGLLRRSNPTVIAWEDAVGLPTFLLGFAFLTCLVRSSPSRREEA